MNTPIELVLEVLTKHQLAEACGIDLTTIYYWLDFERRGEGGYIPSRYIGKLYLYLRAHNIPFSLERLVGLPPRARSGKRKTKLAGNSL